jgi:hypothetical protein
MRRVGGTWFIKCKCGFIIEGNQPSRLVRDLYNIPWKEKNAPNENIPLGTMPSLEGIEVRPPEGMEKRNNRLY